MKKNLFFLFSLLLFLSCSKEEYPTIEYQVNSSSSTWITYTMVTNSIRQETVSGSWKVSFRHSKGSSVFLSAIHGGLGTTTISVYANNKLLNSKSSQLAGELIQISEIIP